MISWNFIPRDIGLLVGGGLMLYYAIKALRTKEFTPGLYRTYTRSDNPVAYWISVGIYAGLGVFGLVGFIMHRI